jgi:hypothetical protein
MPRNPKVKTQNPNAVFDFDFFAKKARVPLVMELTVRKTMKANRRPSYWAWVLFAMVWQNSFISNGEALAQPSSQRVFTPSSLITDHLWLAPPRTMQVSLGGEARLQWQAPVSDLQSARYRFPVLRLDIGVSSNVVLQIQGALQQFRVIDEAASPFRPGMPASRITRDYGDFSIATIMRFWQNRQRDFALGLSIETRLPNSTQRKGIGSNTTDIFLSALASKMWKKGLVFGDLGLGILSAPLETNVQNDVLLYGLGTIWNVHGSAQLFGEINGYLTTRNIIPAGTEARGTAHAGCAWQFGPWGFEAGVQHGLTDNEGKWGGMLALTRKISW